MKRKLLIVVMAIALTFSCCAAAFAAVPNGGDTAQPYNTSSMTFAIERTSATKAEASILVIFSQSVDRYSVTVYLQKLNSDGTWSLATENSDYVLYNNGIQSRSFTFDHIYQNLNRGTTYRLKCVSKDYIGDNTYISTGYSYSF
ncbi:MAG: hypothetical protein ACI4LY_06780 [Candidatus Fimisoma sp.]